MKISHVLEGRANEAVFYTPERHARMIKAEVSHQVSNGGSLQYILRRANRFAFRENNLSSSQGAQKGER